MLYKFVVSLCLLSAAGLALAQDKPEPRYKPIPDKRAVEGSLSDKTSPAASSPSAASAAAAKPTDNAAPRASLARPATSGPEPMMKLGTKNKPFTQPIEHTIKLDYYDCDGIVAPWFREVVVAEMNYFAELNQMPFVKGDACVVTVGTDKSLTPGRVSIQLYANVQRLNDCIRNEICVTFRSVNMVEKDNKRIYRSYFLSDMGRKLIAQYCVTDKGKLHNDTTCYSVP